ncbi:hypothetical protein [Archangium sp.]|uniref:hypothetical protein n=1 Tax=Archangium sp. TaxID=1872627 RepID=UPI002D3D352B|nr:hypothetical protein [Archangium sp.]HYO58098.1 hypothetical protein [Archangium sp.]
MRDYLFVDGNRLDLFLQQNQNPPKKKLRRKKTISLSITGPKVEVAEESSDSPLTLHERIEALIAQLREQDLLTIRRPTRLDDPVEEARPFVLEEMLACKLVFPKSALDHIPGVQELVLWVSDPNPEDLKIPDYKTTGTFLYLTEVCFDKDHGGRFWSGCSALQVIGNALTGKQLFQRSFLENDPLGFGSYLHPVRKLIGIGATTTGEVRKIIALYQKRYFSDEQCFEFSGTNYRTNDLLGHPVFIAIKLN